MSATESLFNAIRLTVTQYNMLRWGTRVGVAVSGGVDSTVLLHAFQQLRADLGIQLSVVHIDHGLRPASAEDAEFVRTIAGNTNAPLHILCAPATKPLSDIEQWARNLRHHFFEELIAAGAIDCVATAHTRSDQAETVFMRLLRGSGVSGLAGIAPVNSDERIVRPLFHCLRAELIAYAKESNLAWREDESNADHRFFRNRVRHLLLPEAERSAQLPVTEILAATADLARDEEDYWSEQVEGIFGADVDSRSGSCLLVVQKLRSFHRAVARRVVRRCVRHVRGNLRGIDLAHIEAVLALTTSTEGSGRVQLPGVDVIRSFDYLRLAVPEQRSRFQRMWSWPVGDLASGLPRQFSTSSGRAIYLEMQSLGSPERYNEELSLLDIEALSGDLELRSWQPGDLFQPPGRSVQRVKTLFQEARIPIWDRAEWPVLAAGSTVYWTRRWGAADPVLPRDNTRRVLLVREIEFRRAVE